jgi:hypothetical protein
MNNFRAALLIATGFLVSAGAINTASAQVAISGNYYEETGIAICSSASSCTLELTATPAQVLFTKINCTLTVTNQAVFIQTLTFAVRDVHNGSQRRTEYLAVPVPLLSNGTNFYAVVSPSDFLFGAGRIPTLAANWSAAANGGMSCKVTGRIQP